MKRPCFLRDYLRSFVYFEALRIFNPTKCVKRDALHDVQNEPNVNLENSSL
jgi:hypothetical protein